MYRNIFRIAFTTLLIYALSAPMAGQDNAVPQKPAERKITAYHLDLSINELTEGKKINSRHYSMNIASGQNSTNETLNIGTRVPVQAEFGKFEYLDLGTLITVQMNPGWGGFAETINVNVEVSSIADPDQAKGAHPLLRQMHLAGSSLLIPDKQLILASADDPDSKHEFQLTVTATKLTP